MSAATDWPKWREMHGLRLVEGPSDGVELPIAPTMKNITHQGERYFRMENSRCHLEDGTLGGGYLWDRYWDEVLMKRDQLGLPL